jgi:hypothetical protein
MKNPFKRKTIWEKRQEVAAPSRFYGDGGTIHSSGTLDIRVKDGHVTEVWFRCQQLPFRVHIAGLLTGYGSTNNDELPFITGVHLLDPLEPDTHQDW